MANLATLVTLRVVGNGAQGSQRVGFLDFCGSLSRASQSPPWVPLTLTDQVRKSVCESSLFFFPKPCFYHFFWKCGIPKKKSNWGIKWGLQALCQVVLIIGWVLQAEKIA